MVGGGSGGAGGAAWWVQVRGKVSQSLMWEVGSWVLIIGSE